MEAPHPTPASWTGARRASAARETPSSAQACLATDLALALLASGDPQLADYDLPADGSQLLPDMLRVC